MQVALCIHMHSTDKLAKYFAELYPKCFGEGRTMNNQEGRNQVVVCSL